MRDFMMITEKLINGDRPVVDSDEPFPSPPPPMTLVEELQRVIFKLRAFTDPSDDDATAYGIETGMQRAAEMIENVITRHQPTDGVEDDASG